MSYLKFNHVFFGLLVLSFCSAMLLPSSISRLAQANVQVLFAPVASPVRSISAWAHNKLTPKTVHDDGSPKQPRVESVVYAENAMLRQQIALLSSELGRLQATEKERDRLTWLRGYCTPYSVFGGDAGMGSSLHITASSFEGLKQGMPAIVADGVVGKIERAGIAGATVQLITARSSRTGVHIVRIDTSTGKAQFQKLTSMSIAEGLGNGKLQIPLVKSEELSHVQVGDMVVLDDADWPSILQSFRIGRVTEMSARKDSPAFGQVTVESSIDLAQLREVMIVSDKKKQATAVAKVPQD